MKFRIVRVMKRYGPIRVANAFSEIGYRAQRPSGNVETMATAVPRIALEQALARLVRDYGHVR